MANAVISTFEIQNEIISQLQAANFDPDNDLTVGALVGPFNDAIGTVNDQVINSRNRNILIYATGSDLEEKAAEFGVTKDNQSPPYDNTFTNFYVALRVGTAKDYTLDKNAPLVIPSNAISINDIDGNSFVAADDLLIEPDSFSVYSPISALENIAGGVPAGTIVVCSVDINLVENLDPAKAAALSFSCSNTSALTQSSTILTDTDLRDAALLRINSMNNTNRDAIRLALRSVGIEDITFKQDMFGYGTLGVIVRIGGSPRLSTAVIKNINNLLANVSPFTRVVEPEVISVKFTAYVTYKDATLITQTQSEILSSLRNYFLTFDLGSSLDPIAINELMTNITNVDTFEIKCIFLDGRPCVRTRQNALSDQIFSLDETTPMVFVA